MSLGIDGLEDVVQIGTGGSSRVYRAHQSLLDRVVAVKVINSGHDADVARRFDRERKAMGRLSNHEGIVPVYSTGLTAQGDPYLVMPYYPSGSLQDQIDAGPMPWQVAVSYVQAAAETIAAAHAAGVVHLDLKPANILLTRNGSPRIADFGIAKLTSAGSTARTTGTAFTPAYSAPETFLDGEASPAADVYGLGATLWALLVGHPPFLTPGDDANLMAVIGRVVNNTVGDVGHLAPAPVCQVIYKALAKQPGDRYATAADFSAALRAAVTGAATDRGAADATRPIAVPAAPIGGRNEQTKVFGNQPPLIPSARTIGPGPAAAAGAAAGAAGYDHRPPAMGIGVDDYARGASPPYGYGSNGEPGRSRSLLQPEHEVAPHAVTYSEPPDERHPLLDFDRLQIGPVVVGLLALIGVGLLSIWAFTRDSGPEMAVSDNAEIGGDPAAPTVDADSGGQGALDLSGSVDPEADTTNGLIAGRDDATTTATSAVTTTTARTTSSATVATSGRTSSTATTTSSTTSTTEATTSSSTSTSSSTTSTTIAGGDLQPPENLSGSYANGVVTLTWSPPSSGPTPIAYAVYRGGELISKIPDSPFVDDMVEPGSYTYRLASVDSDGAETELTPAVTVDVPDNEPEPFAVTVSQTGARRTSLDVEIQANDCMASYRLSWIGPDSSDSLPGRTFADGQCVTRNSETIRGLRPNTTYTINVIAVHGDGTLDRDQLLATTD
jgi:hypothetical protein